MFVPFVSTPSIERRKLWRRKGGGGGGRGGGGGGGRGSSSSSSSSSGSGRGSSLGKSISTSTGARSASTYGRGTTSVSTIPAGSPFAGRTVGGGTRTDVYGSRTYGSGYPGVAGRGVAGRGFPFFFWPIAFGGAAGVGGAAYLHNSDYGDARNSSRPGGAQVVATLVASGDDPETYRLLADSDTVNALVEVLSDECTTHLQSPDSIPVDPYDGSDNEPPHPEQVVQYYRASSVALSLDGYNNSAVFSEDENATDTPLDVRNDALLNCLNTTIGEAVPLIDGAGSLSSPSSMALFGLAGMIWMLVAQV